jgi:hypothetical protein
MTAAASKKVVFLHVMKTGGTTFRGILEAIFQDRFHVCVDPAISAIARDLEQFECVEFHEIRLDNGYTHLHTELVQARRWDLLDNRDIFAIFREPVDHAISLYFYVRDRREKIEPFYQSRGIPFPESLEEFVEVPWHLNNQLAFLTGENQPIGNWEPGHLDIALATEMLERCQIHVGLTERFAEFVHLFQTVTGRAIPGAIESRNRNPNRPRIQALPASLREKIRRLSAPDCELYELARSRFESEIAHCSTPQRFSFY